MYENIWYRNKIAKDVQLKDKKRRDITEVVESYLCHSCGSCFSSCGHDSIAYKESVAGYIFPNINYESCTNCGLCFDVCPGEHFNSKLKEKTPLDPFIGNLVNTYVGFSTDQDIYKHSQSGGVTTSILKYLLDEKIVSAAVVTIMNDISLHNEPRIIYSSSELRASQKSKYVPTSLTSLIPELSKIEGKIAVVGLSCHMHGFENFHKIDKTLNSKLIKIGLICDRVMLYSGIDFLTASVASKNIQKFVFRDTTHTQYPGDTTFFLDNQLNIIDKKNRKNSKDFFTPIRCMLCFDKMNIYSDIVLGDPHGIENTNQINGENLILTRTQIGQEIIDKMVELSYIDIRVASTEDALKGQGIEQKRRKFNANIQAWKELDNVIPDYPSEVFSSVLEVTSEEVKKAKEAICNALILDTLSSREEIMKRAKEFKKSKKSKQTLFSKIKNMFK